VAAYRLLIKRSAARELEEVGTINDRRRIVARINALSIDPRPDGCEKLAGLEDRFRLRQGSYRIVYAVDDRGQSVEVVKIGHRRDVYR
jgi:mRNA interferase RelE/StbE